MVFDKELTLMRCVISIARSLLGTPYKLGFETNSAVIPSQVDCSSFVQWVFSQKGVSLPRYPQDQARQCRVLNISVNEVQAEDLLFGRNKRTLEFDVSTIDAVGHVGIVTERHTVIHAAWRHGCVIEESINDFMNFKNRGLWAGRL